jgi:hypothetical protein
MAGGNRRPRPVQVGSSESVGVAPGRFGSVQLFVATPALHGALSRRVWQPPTLEAPSYWHTAYTPEIPNLQVIAFR